MDERDDGSWLLRILFPGYLWVLVDNRRQALYDKLAGTLVVYSRPEEMGLATSTPVRDRLRELGQEREAGPKAEATDAVG